MGVGDEDVVQFTSRDDSHVAVLRDAIADALPTHFLAQPASLTAQATITLYRDNRIALKTAGEAYKIAIRIMPQYGLDGAWVDRA